MAANPVRAAARSNGQDLAVQPDPDHATDVLKQAEQYLALGWSMLPLSPRSPRLKRPCGWLLPLGSDGHHHWSLLPRTTMQHVERWLELEPDVNIGIITGLPSLLAVVDVDRPALLHLPESPMALTGRELDAAGRRGFHAYYRIDRRVAGRKYPWGELRADGNYVAAPPSLYDERGRRYEWSPGLSPGDVAIAPLPEELSHEHPVFEGAPGKRGTRRVHQAPKSSPPSILYSKVHQGPRNVVPSAPCAGEAGRIRDAALTDGAFASDVSALLGIRARPGASFRCVLPGHEDRHPSATITDDPSGIYRYHCRGCLGEGRSLALAETMAAVKSGEVGPLRPAQLWKWTNRLLIETGRLVPPSVPEAPLPPDSRPAIRAIYRGFLLLLQCTRALDPDAATAFTWSFGSAWCGKSVRHVREAFEWLLAEGYITKAGWHYSEDGRKFALYLPGPGGRWIGRDQRVPDV